MFFLLFVMLVMFGCYIKERERERERERKKKNPEKWGRGVNCEEEMREKNEIGEGGCMCVVGEKKKKKGRGGTWVVGKKKKANKKEKKK
jgi:hypothetical protein